MSLSKGLNADECQVLRSLLQRAKQTGSIEAFLPSLGSEASEWSEVGHDEEVSFVGMNDASKRRLVNQDQHDGTHGQTKQCLSEPTVSAESQSPPSAVAVTKIDFSQKEMPTDVKNVEDWGSTVMAEGKMAPRKMSYAELAASKEVEIQRYLRWLMGNVNAKNLPQYQDLAHYLFFTKYGEASGPAGFSRIRKSG